MASDEDERPTDASKPPEVGGPDTPPVGPGPGPSGLGEAPGGPPAWPPPPQPPPSPYPPLAPPPHYQAPPPPPPPGGQWPPAPPPPGPYPPPPAGYYPPPPGQYPPPQGQWPTPYGQYPPYPQQSINPLAIISLVLGIVGWPFIGLGSAAALVLGLLALSQIKRSVGHQQGQGIAITGVVLGGVGVAFWVLLLIGGIAAQNFGN